MNIHYRINIDSLQYQVGFEALKIKEVVIPRNNFLKLINNHKLRRILTPIALAVMLCGCAATLVTYEPIDNPNVLDAMQSIRNKILAQPPEKAPLQVEVTESTLKIIGNFEGIKVKQEASPMPISAYFLAHEYQKYNEKAIGLIEFKDITEMRYHVKRGWFMVTLVNNQKDGLFRYFSHSETDAKQFMDNVHTLMTHKIDLKQPIALSSKPLLSPAELKKQLMALEIFGQNPDANNFKEAEPKFLGTLDNIEQSSGKNSEDVDSFTNNLAVIYQSLGKYEQAEPLYLRSLAIKEKAFGKDHIEVTSILDNLTKLYAEQGRFELAEIFGIKSLAIKEKTLSTEDVSVIASLNNLSAIYQARKHYEQADKYNQRSLSMMEKIVLSGRLTALSAIHTVLAPKLNPIPNPPKGMVSFANGVNEAAAIANIVIGGIVLAGYIYNLFDDDILGGSNKHHKVANTIALAEIYHAQGNYEQAELKAKEALDVNTQKLGSDHTEVANSLNRLAKVYYAQGKYSEAKPLLDQALAINEKKLGHDHPTVAEGLNNLALLYAAQTQYEQAKPLLQRSLRSINQSLDRWLWGAGEKTRQAYLQQQEARRDLYLSFYSLTNASEEAFYFSLARKGLLLRISSEVSALAKQSTDPEIQKQTQTFNALRTQLSGLSFAEKTNQSEIQRLEEEGNELERQLSQKISSFKRNKTDVTAAQVIENLKPDQSVVDFMVYTGWDFKTQKSKAKQVIALVANKNNGVQLVKLGDFTAMEQAIKTFRKAINNQEPLTTVSQILYQQLWQPITPYLQNTKTVYLIPDGQLHLLPFKALQDKAGKYLGAQQQLITLSSARDIVLPRETAKSSAPAIFAAPDFGNDTVHPQNTNRAIELNNIFFSELPGTLKEGQQIDQLFAQKLPKSPAKLFINKQATEHEISKAASPKILHLATHGFFLEDMQMDEKTLERGLLLRSAQIAAPQFIQNPLLRSGLAFTGANLGVRGIKQADKTDGILTALEVLNLNLEGTDLVTLSACQTAVGDVKVGEGVYSLNRAFQEAGAKAVLSSLWAIDDEATGKFMQKFYARFLDGKLPQQALQATQNEFMQDTQYSNPYYWAGFVMMGKE